MELAAYVAPLRHHRSFAKESPIMRPITACALTLALLAALLPGALPAHAGVNTWTPLGPPAFGPIAHFIVDPHTPTTFYILREFPQTGIHKSTDGGLTWQWLDLASPSGRRYVTLFAPDPTNSNVLYAGVGSESLYKSTDGGDTWQAINNGLLSSPDSTEILVSELVVDPQTPTTLYVAVYNRGLYKSTDGGASWSHSSAGLPSGVLFQEPSATPGSIVIDPQTPSTLYLIMPWEGVFKSVDAGATWQTANNGLPTRPATDPADEDGQIVEASWVILDPQTPTTLYASTSRGLYKSVDGAASWQPVAQEGLPIGSDGYLYITWLTFDPAAPQTWLATMTDPNEGRTLLYRSTDGGASWTQVTIPTVISSGAIMTSDGQTPQTLYVYTRGSGLVFRSSDNGDTWKYAPFGAPFGAPIDTLTVDPHDPAKLYATSWGTGFFRTQDSGQSWMGVNSIPATTGIRGIGVDPQAPGRLYATTYSGLFASEDGGDSWQPLGAGLPANAVVQLLVDPQTPTNLYAQGTLGVLRSEDRGQTWIIANAGLPTDYCSQIPQIPTVHSIALDMQTPTSLYVTVDYCQDDHTHNAAVFKTTDGAWTWAEASKGLPPTYYSYNAQLLVDPQSPATLYLWGDYDFVDAQFYRSVNGGRSWAAVKVRDLPTGVSGFSYMRHLATDPSRAGILYATVVDDYFYTSVDSGNHWYAFPAGLPQDTGVSTIVVDPATVGRVYIGTSSGVHVADLSAILSAEVIVLGTPPADAWTLTGPRGDFTLPATGGKQQIGRLSLGMYDVNITPQPGYTVAGTCTHGTGAGTTATAHAAAGQRVTCTFYAAAGDAPRALLPVIGE
jgi:photosystem II stability/assembly factor-like uncharacterized protein